VKSQRPLFTHTLSYVLLSAVALYLISNVMFVMACTSHITRFDSSDACGIPRSLRFFADVVPAIYRPVKVLEQQGNHARAMLVAGTYSFAWLSGVAALLFMSISAMLTFALADDKALQRLHAHLAESRKWAKPHERGLALKGTWVLSAVMLFLFADVYWGFYKFDGWSSRLNMVHVRNGDLYRLAIDWAFLLLLAIVFMFAVGNRVWLKAWRRRNRIAEQL
jgi:hypothetical protein